MINILLNLYNFHEKWAKDALEKYINYNDKVLIIPFSFKEDISNNTEWQRAYSKDNGKYYKSVVQPFLDYGITEENINWVNYF